MYHSSSRITPGGGSKKSNIWNHRSKKKNSKSNSNSNSNGSAHASGGEEDYMNQTAIAESSLLGNPDILDPSESIKKKKIPIKKLLTSASEPINFGTHNTFVIWGHGCTIDTLKKYVTKTASKATVCSKNAGETSLQQKQIYAEHSARLNLIGTKSPIKMVDQTSDLHHDFTPPPQVFVYTPVRFGQDMYSWWWGESNARITPSHIEREAYVPDELCEGKYKLFEYSASGIEGTYELPNIYVTGSKEENQVCGIKHSLSKKWLINFKKVTNDKYGNPNANSYKNAHTFDKLVEFITEYVNSPIGQRNGTNPREPIRIITGFCLGGINPYIAYTQTRGLEGALSGMTLECSSSNRVSASSTTATTITPKKTKKKTPSVFLKKKYRLSNRNQQHQKKQKMYKPHPQPQRQKTQKRIKFVLKKNNNFKAKIPKSIRRRRKGK